MEADRLITALKAHLSPKVVAAGGIMDVADHPWEVVDLLKVSPQKWRVILSLEDEEAAEARCPGGWVVGTFSLYLQIHKGFAADRGASIYKTSQGGQLSATTLAAKIRRWMRGISFPDNQDIAEDDGTGAFAFTGAQWIGNTADEKDKEKPWRVRRLDFQLVYALDDPATDDDPDGNDVVIPDALHISGISDDGAFYLLVLNGETVGRVPRFDTVEGDPGGTGTGWRILEGDDPTFYIVALGGVAHGRIPRFTAA